MMVEEGVPLGLCREKSCYLGCRSVVGLLGGGRDGNNTGARVDTLVFHASLNGDGHRG